MSTGQISMRSIRRMVCWGVFFVILSIVLTLTIWRLMMVSEVNGRLDKIRAAHLPVDATELNAWYPAVPDSENAALVLNQAFALMRDYSDERSNLVAQAGVSSRTDSLSPADRLLLIGYVEMNRGAIEKARMAITLSRSRYPVDLSNGLNIGYPHLKPAREMAIVLQDEVLLLEGNGHEEEITQDIKALLGMARSLDSEPVVLSHIVRNSIIQMAVTVTERELNKDSLGDRDLADLQACFAAAEKTDLLMRAIVGERAKAISVFRDVYRKNQTVPAGSIARSPKVFTHDLMVKWFGPYRRDLNFYLGVMDTNISIISYPPPKTLAFRGFLATNGNRAEVEGGPPSAVLISQLDKVVDLEAKSFASVRIAQVAIAVERYRLANHKLPENLSSLVPKFLATVPADPFDGAALRYKVRSNGYVVYSIGKDLHDDGGKEPQSRQSSGPENPPEDITFTVETLTAQ